MSKGGFSRIRMRFVSRGALLLALAATGCSGGDYGSVPASSNNAPAVAEAGPAKKIAPAPRVPRGPDQAKALQEAAKK
jgi:hypothetical protein